MRFFFFLVNLILFLYPSISFALENGDRTPHIKSQPAGLCQISRQYLNRWSFRIQEDSNADTLKPLLKSDFNAYELFTMQKQYFSGKSSPFLHFDRIPELSFYTHGIRLSLEPYVTYNKTVDGRFCATVVGAILHVKHNPTINLAKELTSSSCVAKTAIDLQIQQHHAAQLAIRQLFKEKEKAKSFIFETYESTGAAGNSRESIAQQLQLMEDQALERIVNSIEIGIHDSRLGIYTPELTQQLNKACQGQFLTASKLALQPH